MRVRERERGVGRERLPLIVRGVVAKVPVTVARRAAPRAPPVGHIRELDGLRVIAVLLVFLNHYAPVVSIPRLGIIREIGWIGVDIFFVISGLLITGILLDSRGNRRYFQTFYVRRSLRIFPLYYAVVVAVLACMALDAGGEAYGRLVEAWGSPGWFFAYLGNVRTAVTNISPPKAFVPMWSLHVEEQFYLLFPFVVFRLGRVALRRALIAVVVAAPLIRTGLAFLFPEQPLVEYMLLPCRMDGLAWGALIALRLRGGPVTIGKGLLGAVAAVLSVAACVVFVAGGRRFDSLLERTAGYSLFAAAAAAWILWVVLFRGSALTGWLNARPLRYLGKISYGLYLFQTPIAVGLTRLMPALGLPPEWLRTTAGSLTMAGLCVALASLSWYAMERPLLRLKDRWAPSTASRAAAFDGAARSTVAVG